jgi:hypothetical protein
MNGHIQAVIGSSESCPSSGHSRPLFIADVRAAADRRPAGARADQLQPWGRVEGAHQQVHRDHSAQRRYVRGRAEHLRRATAQDTGQQRHDGESRRRREGQPVGRPERAGVPAGRLPVGSAGTGLAYGFVLAFRNAASPASDTSTQVLSGAAPAT